LAEKGILLNSAEFYFAIETAINGGLVDGVNLKMMGA